LESALLTMNEYFLLARHREGREGLRAAGCGDLIAFGRSCYLKKPQHLSRKLLRQCTTAIGHPHNQGRTKFLASRSND
ncbi:MAG TPA: hypothetical protein PKN99_08860, partial [Cyclobacteriaceae bacterium]|nr:hypothetical protein [Cyclobacteriaceae bacterium]